MPINQLTESVTSYARPSVSTPTDSQKSQQPTEASNTQNVRPLPTAIKQSNTELEAISDEKIQQAVDQMQDFTNKAAKNLKFSIDEDTGKTVVKVLDSQTQEVIRQFPSEEAISIARTLDKVQGLLFSDKA